MLMPFFSIVIPVYNKERFIAQTLKSVLNQTFLDFEIIIVNDGSTDNSEKQILAIRDNRIRYVSKKNEGVAIARNFGIEKATADFICFLDADDYWYPHFLETMHTYIMELPHQKVFASAIELETKKRRFPACYSFPKTSAFEIVNFFDASHKEAVLWTSSVAIHKEIFSQIGVFDEKLKISEDTDLWIRIGLRYEIVFIWQILARYVFDAESISRNRHYIFEDAFFSKYSLEEQNNPALKKYMDLNRFSTVIKHEIIDNRKEAQEIYAEIDLKNLSRKKRFLLQLSPVILKILIRIKNLTANLGFGNTVFR